MAYFFDQILFRQWVKGDYKTRYEDTYRVFSVNESLGVDIHLVDDKHPILGERIDHIKDIAPGAAFLLFSLIAKAVSSKGSPKAECGDSKLEVYLLRSGQPLFLDEQGNPIPSLVSPRTNLCLGGHEIVDLAMNDHGIYSPKPLGADLLEALFDTDVPFGFEGLGLKALLTIAEESGNPGLAKQTRLLIRNYFLSSLTVLHLPEDPNEPLGYLLAHADSFRKMIEGCKMRNDVETAFLHGSAFLWKWGYKAEANDYIVDLAESGSRPACLTLAKRYLDADDRRKSLKYACLGASFGSGECAYMAAERLKARRQFSLEKDYLQLGMKAGNGDCFYLMARDLMTHSRNNDKKSPFFASDPLKEAIELASEGVNRHSSKAMVYLSRLISDNDHQDESGLALQLLERARYAGDKETYFWLGEYYLKTYREGMEDNLLLAEAWVKKAIVEEAYDLWNCQHLYACIEARRGNKKEGLAMVEELARKGHLCSLASLGEKAAGWNETFLLEGEELPKDVIPQKEIIALPDRDSFLCALVWRLYPDIVSPEEAIKALESNACLWKKLAYRELAKIYKEGPESVKNPVKAAHFERLYNESESSFPGSAEGDKGDLV